MNAKTPRTPRRSAKRGNSKAGNERRDAETLRREGGGKLVTLRYPEAAPVPRTKDVRCFGVPQHDKVRPPFSYSSLRLCVSAFSLCFWPAFVFLGVVAVLAFVHSRVRN